MLKHGLVMHVGDDRGALHFHRHWCVLIDRKQRDAKNNDLALLVLSEAEVFHELPGTGFCTRRWHSDLPDEVGVLDGSENVATVTRLRLRQPPEQGEKAQ